MAGLGGGRLLPYASGHKDAVNPRPWSGSNNLEGKAGFGRNVKRPTQLAIACIFALDQLLGEPCSFDLGPQSGCSLKWRCKGT